MCYKLWRYLDCGLTHVVVSASGFLVLFPETDEEALVECVELKAMTFLGLARPPLSQRALTWCDGGCSP
jgi:hypothetical protein